MLSEGLSPDRLASLLIPGGDWRPYPTIEERDAWSALPEDLREAYAALGEAALGYEWPALPATLFLGFARIGNRTNYEHVNHLRRAALRDLVLAECVEAQGRYLDDIVNGIWTTCEETYWAYPAHVNAQRAGVGLPDAEEPTVDLFAAETAAQLSWTVYLLGERLDAISPLVRRRVRYEVKRRVLDPCLQRDDFWWMGFFPGSHGVNNWNPWVNSNWLASALILEDDHERRSAAVAKILRSLDVFVGVYGDAGGCDEGPSYWGRAGASLFDCLDLLHSATGGAIDHFGDAKVRNMSRYIYRAHICDGYVINFADASAVNWPPASLVYRYGRAIRDEPMLAFGAWLLARPAAGRGRQEGSLGRILPAVFDIPGPLGPAPRQPLPRDVWFDDIQVMAAREREGAPDGFFVAAKGGHNAESHNHNDVGSLIIYVDGKPVVVDAGVETYRRQTFSPQRYEVWTMQSAYHTLLPTFEVGGRDGVMQAPGISYAARDVRYDANDAEATLSFDLAPAYPAEAGVSSWLRVITLQRGRGVKVTDAFELARVPKAITLGLLTPCDVSVDAETVAFAAAPVGPKDAERRTGSARLVFDAAAFDVVVERIEIDDTRLGAAWGDHLTRVVFRSETPPVQGTWTWRFLR